MNRRNIICYIAGPYRGKSIWHQVQNIRSAEALALDVWKLGMTAVCPHLNTMNFQGVLSDEVWLKGDLVILSRCDAVLMTHDWQDSAGAKAEHVYALEHGIPIVYSILGLEFWAATQTNVTTNWVKRTYNDGI